VTAERLLALDVGTQSVRALACDPAGGLVGAARVPIEPYVSPRPGWAEQDPEVYWTAAAEACAGLWAAGVDPLSVAAVAPTCQRATVVVAGARGRRRRRAPLRTHLAVRERGAQASTPTRADGWPAVL
jgi:sugar (pentulose or hexulose) kinase